MKNYILLILLLIIVIGCKEKVCIIQEQGIRIEIDTFYSYKVKCKDNSLRIYETNNKYIKGDSIKIYED